MAWILVYINISAFGIEAIPIELYQKMDQCFAARAELIVQNGGKEFFPVNKQAICIRTDIM